VFATGKATISVVCGTLLAFVIARTDTPLRGLYNNLAIIPMLISPTIYAICWILLLSPRIGLLNLLLIKTFGLEATPFNIYSIPALMFVGALPTIPLAFLIIRSALLSMDPALEESARIAGCGPLKAAVRITLPLIRPAIVSAFILIFVIGLGIFETVALIGGPAGFKVYTTRIFDLMNKPEPRFDIATSYAILNLLIAVVAVSIYQRVTKAGYRFATVRGRAGREAVIKLGWRKYIVSGLIMLFFC
jgi:iron(III) transport system permease protein